MPKSDKGATLSRRAVIGTTAGAATFGVLCAAREVWSPPALAQQHQGIGAPVTSDQISTDYVSNYPARYMGGEANLVTAPNGGVVYDKALEAAGHVWYTERTVDKIADGIWVIGQSRRAAIV